MSTRRMANEAATTPATGARRTAEEIRDWIVAMLEKSLELAPGEIDVEQPLDCYGLDSAEAVRLVSALEDWLGRELPVNLVYQHPTVAVLARHLAAIA